MEEKMSRPFFRLLLSASIGLSLSVLTLLLLSAKPATAQVQCGGAPDTIDWIITVDCTLLETQAAARNVVVRNDAELTIPDGVTLGVGFDSYSLRVENGSRLLVQNGGRIATFRCPGIDPDLLDAPYRFEYGLTANDLIDRYYDQTTGLFSQGYRPHRLTGYLRGDEVRFATDWIQIGGPERPSSFDLLDIDFEQRFNTFSPTHRLIDVSAYNFPSGEARFADIWVENSEGLGWWVFPADTLTLTQQRIADYASLGRVPVRIEAYQDEGVTRYISLWVEGNCKWIMNPQMTLNSYNTLSAAYASTYRQEHVEQYTQNGNAYYAAIWYQRPALEPAEPVWVNTDWYLFQRNVNNNWCNGFRLTNFYAADHPDGVDGVRFGGIWTFDEPLNVTQASPLSLKVQQEVNCAIARSGAAIVRVNADTGEVEDEIYAHAGQVFGTSSTIKIAIMLQILRLIDNNDQLTLNTLVNVGQQYGTNQPCTTMTCTLPRLNVSQTLTLGYLMQTMIADSNNWAANRLIDCLANLIDQNGQIDPFCTKNQDGMAVFNQAMQQPDLNLPNTRLRRYMGCGFSSSSPLQSSWPGTCGTTGPNPSSVVSYTNGLDATSTPQEMVDLLRMVHDNVDRNGNMLLLPFSYSFYWNTMGLDGDDLTGLITGNPGDGVNNKGNIQDIFTSAIGSAWPTTITVYNKDGANRWSPPYVPALHKPQIISHTQLSDVGRMNLDNDGDGYQDSYVFYAIYNDESFILGSNYTVSQTLLGRTIACIGAQVAREYTGQTTGITLTTLTPPCQSP
jgi:hypothetical protein